MVKPDGEPAVGSLLADPSTEGRILDAADVVFRRRGTAGARMAEVALEAGVNKALLHYYFRSKAGLSAAVFARAARQLFPALLRALAADEPLETKVARVVALELDQLSRTPYLPGYLLGELHQHPERPAELIALMSGQAPDAVRAALFGTLGRQIEAEVAAGRMRPMAPEDFLINLLSLCIFPFAARPMLQALCGWDDSGFAAMIERRRTELPVVFLAGLRP